MVKLKNKIYDFVIIHSGFGGAIIAHKLAATGKKVALVKTISAIGQEDVFVSTENGRLKKSLAIATNTEKNRHLLDWFSQAFGITNLYSEYDQAIKTVDSGSLVNFLGFGDQKFKSIDMLNPWNTNDFLHINESIEDIHQNLLSSKAFDLYEDAEVTSVEISEDSVQSIGINGSKDLAAKYFILADSLKPFFDLLSELDVNPKVKSRVAKSKPWSQVCLHLESKAPVTDDLSLHMLMGSKADFEPCLGRFFKAEDGGGQHSVWMTLVESEMLEDTEFLGSSLKNLKRQIKRAYENLFDADQIANEKIVVLRDSFGHVDLGIKDGLIPKGTNNLILTNTLQFESRGIMADLEVASQALAFIEDSKLSDEISTPEASQQ